MARRPTLEELVKYVHSRKDRGNYERMMRNLRRIQDEDRQRLEWQFKKLVSQLEKLAYCNLILALILEIWTFASFVAYF